MSVSGSSRTRSRVGGAGSHWRLRTRLQLTGTVLSLFLLGLGAWAVPTYVSQMMYREAELNVSRQMLNLMSQIEAPLAFADEEAVRLELQKLGLDALEYAEVRVDDVRLIWLEGLASAPPSPPLIFNVPVTWRQGQTIHGAIRFRGTLGESVVLGVGFSQRWLAEAEVDLQQSALAASLVLAGVLGFLLSWMGRRTVLPIEQATRLADAIAGGELASVQIPDLREVPENGDEPARLERALSMMVLELREKRAALEDAQSGLQAQVAKQTAEISHALQEAQAANKAKTRFLANMSHEIRTPMNGVLGMAHQLQSTTLSPSQEEMVHIISETGQNLMNLLNQILDMSKVEAGHLVLEQRPYNIRHVLGSVTKLFRASAHSGSIDLQLDITDRVPVALNGDAFRLRQITGNLINNALKFTIEGTVRVLVDYHDGALKITVSDTGAGIPADRLAAIFEVFTQADSSTSRTHGGTGLGLHICQQLVGLMSGRLGVESVLGEGSSFWFEIPQEATTVPSEPPELRAPHIHIAKKITVLLVDDNPVNLKVASYLLQRCGVAVVSVNGGLEAVDAAARSDFDLILMDCMMPEVDGYEATRRIRAAGASIPIIALTASVLAEDRLACLEAGMNDVLSKPVTSEAITDLIERYLH